MKPSPSLWITIIFVQFLACNQPSGRVDPRSDNQPLNGQIIIYGAYALTPFIQACAQKFQESNPQAYILVKPMAHDSALNLLQLDSCQLAMISRPPRADEEHMFAIPVAKTGVVFIFNKDNPYKSEILSHGLTINDLQKVYSTDPPHSWSELMGRKQGVLLNACVRADQSGASEVLADFLYLEPSDLRGIPVTGEHEMIRAVASDPNALGYCNINDAFDLATGQKLTGIEFLPVDLNMNGSIENREEICASLDDFTESICHTTYPFRLSRNLYMVTTEKPEDPLVRAFLWFVIDEGQVFLEDMGYARIPESLISYNRFLLQ